MKTFKRSTVLISSFLLTSSLMLVGCTKEDINENTSPKSTSSPSEVVEPNSKTEDDVDNTDNSDNSDDSADSVKFSFDDITPGGSELKLGEEAIVYYSRNHHHNEPYRVGVTVDSVDIATEEEASQLDGWDYYGKKSDAAFIRVTLRFLGDKENVSRFWTLNDTYDLKDLVVTIDGEEYSTQSFNDKNAFAPKYRKDLNERDAACDTKFNFDEDFLETGKHEFCKWATLPKGETIEKVKLTWGIFDGYEDEKWVSSEPIYWSTN